MGGYGEREGLLYVRADGVFTCIHQTQNVYTVTNVLTINGRSSNL